MYYITTTEQAYQITRDEALRRNCKAPTLYWWGVMICYEDPSLAAVDLGNDTPPDLEPLEEFLPPEWFPPESEMRAAAEERERAS